MMEVEQKLRRGNVITGTVGAFLGSLVGVACIILVGRLGFVASISGVVMAVCAIRGYELLGGGLDKKGAVISGVLVLVMTFFAHRLDWAIALATQIDIKIIDAFRAISVLLEEGYLESGAYWGGLAMLYLFTLVGAIPAITGGLKDRQSSVFPSWHTEGEDGVEERIVFYPAQKGWMRSLRLIVCLSMFLPLIVAAGLLFVGAVGENQLLWALAATGALLATLVAFGLAMGALRLCQADNTLFARDEADHLWKVQLNPLNTIDTYRFTSKNGAMRALSWDRLTTEERERAKTGISRAMSDLRSGKLLPGSAVGGAVTPLPELELVKEDSWQWKTTYLTGNGRKKLSIPKAYPNLRPVRETEAAQQPVPARWSLLGIVLVCALLFAAVGGGIGYLVDKSVSAVPTDGMADVEAAVEAAVTEENYQSLFQPALDMGYRQTGLAYYKGPEEMFGREAFLEAYLPYGGEPVYSEDGQTVETTAHGMQVRQTTAYTVENAAAVVDAAYEALVASGVDVYEDAVYETEYSEEYDISYKQVAFFEENRTKSRVAILYADFKQEHYYLSAQITYLPEQMDEDYPALLAELTDAFGLTLPDFSITEEL